LPDDGDYDVGGFCVRVHLRCSTASAWMSLNSRRAASSARPGRARPRSWGCINYLEKINSGRQWVDGQLLT
jgi:hypothetical protein